ncbi:TBC1 domain family member 2A isoform X1 [Conger conger]|uniref:TBC1 domain family member 2A isoform X1 n=2 Tax=Conger conger TaxID=82655 RepID=UPI002A59E510|nr:TBC1 domain family member 2A isoform X1 [Conger conger]
MMEFEKITVTEEEYPDGTPCAAMSPALPLQTGSPTVNDDIAAPGVPGEVTVNGMGAVRTGEQRNEACPRPGGPEPKTKASGTKLCGYLSKLGGRLKNWKSRWFTYEEGKCQLFYYRTAQDVNPLGRIELCNATFGYVLQADRGTFEIETPERTYILKAVSHQAMMYWLQQLQLKRWQNRDCPTGESAQTCADVQTQCAEGDFLPPVNSPTGVVGQEAARLPAPQRHLSNVSFKHPVTEIQNSVHTLRVNRSPREVTRSNPHCQEQQEPSGTETNTKRSQDTPVPFTLDVAVLLANSRRKTQSLSPTLRNKKKSGSLSTMPAEWRQIGTDPTSRLQQDVFSLTQEVKAQKELVQLLQKALETVQREKRASAQFLSAEDERERQELLRHRERHAADLSAQLEELLRQKGALERSVARKDGHIAELQEHVVLMVEESRAKQEVVLKLSERVGARSEARALQHQQAQVQNLKDDIEAYMIQNKFLNSEIYQLTQLWRNSSEQGRNLMVKCAYLEAKNCQVESRYLGVLRKLQGTKGLDHAQKEEIKKLIEDALQGDVNDALKLNPVREYDEYGFKIIPDYEVEDMRLLAKIQALEIRSNNLLQQEAVDRPLLGRWAQYMSGRSSGELAASPELKDLLRAGVPREYRRQVWRWLVHGRTASLRERYPSRYQELCGKTQASQHPAFRQIQLDLHRTLTTNRCFSSPSNPAVQQLQRILLAFSWQNPTIGYCQGLNRLAAIALLVLQSEEDAFWCLVAVVEMIMPQDYYSKDLIASQVDQRVLKDFMVEKMPRLMAHFEEHNIDVSLITFNWFLVVFVECLASDILLRLWDAFLYEGTKVIFRYTLALFKYKEEDMLKIHDSVEIYQYLRFFTKTISDSRRLTNIAFNEMNPFPLKQLRSRRALHLERLQAELAQLRSLQEAFVPDSPDRKDKQPEDDEDA